MSRYRAAATVRRSSISTVHQIIAENSGAGRWDEELARTHPNGRPFHAAASKVRAALRRVRCQLFHNGSWRRIDDDLGVYPTELLCNRCGLCHRVWLWRWRSWGTQQPG